MISTFFQCLFSGNFDVLFCRITLNSQPKTVIGRAVVILWPALSHCCISVLEFYKTSWFQTSEDYKMVSLQWFGDSHLTRLHNFIAISNILYQWRNPSVKLKRGRSLSESRLRKLMSLIRHCYIQKRFRLTNFYL